MALAGITKLSPCASDQTVTSEAPQNIDQAMVSGRLSHSSLTLVTTMLPAELAMVAASASTTPAMNLALPPSWNSVQAAPIECQNSSATPAIATTPQPMVRRLMTVPKNRLLSSGVQNTISANTTATRPETTYCSDS